MFHLKRFFRRLLNVVRPGDADQQLAREMASHLALMAAVALLFAVVAVIAALIPASRATRVDPVSALRAD